MFGFRWYRRFIANIIHKVKEKAFIYSNQEIVRFVEKNTNYATTSIERVWSNIFSGRFRREDPFVASDICAQILAIDENLNTYLQYSSIINYFQQCVRTAILTTFPGDEDARVEKYLSSSINLSVNFSVEELRRVLSAFVNNETEIPEDLIDLPYRYITTCLEILKIAYIMKEKEKKE